MKVIHVVSDTNIGGAGKVIINFLKHSKASEINCKVVLPVGSHLSSAIRELGTEVIEVAGLADRSISILGIFEMFKVLSREKPELVHTHAGLSARIAARLLGIKIVLTRHWIGKVQKMKFINNWLCDYAIGVSQEAAEMLIRSGIEERKVAVIENAMEIPKPYTQEDRRIAREKIGIGDEIAIGILARLEEVKGHKYFLEAAENILAEQEKVSFWIGGDGSLAESLKKMSAHIPQIKFLGFVSDTDDFFKAMDVHVLTSSEEAFSLSLMEAMAYGLPNVTTRCGGLTNTLTDGENALLVKHADSKELSEKLLILIKDSRLRLSIGKKARKLVEERYSVESMVKDTIKIYKHICDRL